MTWLTWRQHRGELMIVLIVVLLFGLFLYASDVFLARGDPVSQVSNLRMPLLYPILLLPLLLGVFVGAPLIAREYEQGTARLVWTQGITRRRWFYSKVLLLSAATVILFGALALSLLWWNRPVTPILGPWLLFDNNGFVLVAQALFGLALGIALGALIGKTVPAMALTMLLFIAVRLALAFLRPHYLPPEQAQWGFSGASPQIAQMLVVDLQVVDREGRALTFAQVSNDCPQSLIERRNSTFDLAPLYTCYQEHGFRQALRYQPPERFWLFQGIESGIFLLLSVGLVALAGLSLRARAG